MLIGLQFSFSSLEYLLTFLFSQVNGKWSFIKLNRIQTILWTTISDDFLKVFTLMSWEWELLDSVQSEDVLEDVKIKSDSSIAFVSAIGFSSFSWVNLFCLIKYIYCVMMESRKTLSDVVHPSEKDRHRENALAKNFVIQNDSWLNTKKSLYKEDHS